jgi:hypothetical protein
LYFFKDNRFADVLDVAAGRSDPGQNRVDNAYEGNYDSEKGETIIY